MGLIERLFGRAAGTPAPTQPPPQAYPLAVPYVDATSVLGLSAVWRCVTLIADAIADCPWREYRGETDELDLSRLVRRPMAWMTRREWTWRVVATEALYNTVHLLHVGGSDSEGSPWSLLPLPPDLIIPASQDPFGLLPPTEYVVAGRMVPADLVSVVRRSPFPGIQDQMAGLLRLARREFSAALAADTHLARYWINGGPTVTVIKTDQELTDPEAAAIGQRWVDRRSLGAEYPAVLGKGADAHPFGADPTTDSAVESRAQMDAMVGRYFGVSPRYLNAPRQGDSETYANAEDDASDLHRYTLRGYMGPIEDVISELLPGDYIDGRRMAFDTTRLVQGNLESRARAYPPLIAAGILDQEEARRLGFGLAPRKNQTPAEPTPAALPSGIPAAVTAGGTPA